MAKSIAQMLTGVQTGVPLVPPLQTTENIAAKGPKTGPGQMMAFLAKESKVLQENEDLRKEIADLKASEVLIADLVEIDGRRRVLSADEYQELKANISHNKLTTPITVRPVEGGRYEVVSGHNRVAIFRELGLERIPAFIRDYTPVDAERGAFYANLMHKSLPDYEKYLGFKRIMALTGKTQTEIADEAGVSKTTVSFLMAFDDLAEELKAKIAAKPSGVGARFAAELTKLPNPMKALNALLEEGLSVKDSLKQGQVEVAKPPTKRPPSVLIKSGQKRVAEIVNRSGALTIKFSDPKLAQTLMADIEALIRAKS